MDEHQIKSERQLIMRSFAKCGLNMQSVITKLYIHFSDVTKLII